MAWLSWMCLLFMLFNTCSSFNSSSSLSSRHLCHPDDSSTLLQFKNSFYSNGTIFWEKGKDCCEWSGVTCGKVTGHVIGLNLGLSGLQGNIHSNSSLFFLHHLERLDLSDNDFREKQQVVPIPRHLTELDLFENLLNGTIPSWLGSLPSLEVLSVGSNQLSGDIIEFQSSHSLTRLDFSDNKLHGLIPRSIFELEKVTAFDLSSNNLSGIVEFENFSKLQSLSYLNLSSNHLSLSFHHFSNNTWPQLSILALLSCNISEFPYFLRASPNLETLDLSHNKIQGKVPKWLSAVVKDSLRQLDLSYNFFTGACLGDFSQSLSVLDLRKNKFDGMIPMTFSKGNVLRNLGLDGNQLEGPLPPSLLTCRDLEVLDVGNNKIHDTFPNWLESLPKLQVLILRSNKFHGAIGNPTSKFPFQKLCIMDLSHNLFNGLLPTKYFENLAAMINSQEHELKYMGEGYYHDTVVVTVKGFEIEMVKIQTFFTSIDFSNNSFIGEISNVIGKLKSLKGLNFSNNELTSTIPPSFGELSNLEWLDLSSNGLVGLCGLPLSKTCGAHQSPPSSFRQEGDLEHWNGFDWKVVLMGYASGVVIGISVAYLVLSNGQPNWLVKVIGRKQHRKTVKITQRRA
ncbi:receptor-like protein 12 [Prunus persica]|uniref:receptor-like protein 12 n=1 Tax=Prunus persica TaxID=3760 RepID=UPI0009AB5605|nr:receptor-like protein 12 [Prunus persica]